MPSPSFLPKLPTEQPGLDEQHYDLGLVALLELHLDDQRAGGYEHFDRVGFLSRVMHDDLPHLREGHHALDYLIGRIDWQQGRAKRRPPRGWREGRGVRYVTSGERDVNAYERLNELGRRVVALFVLLGEYADEDAPKDVLRAWRRCEAVERALHRYQRALLPGARARLSPLGV